MIVSSEATFLLALGCGLLGFVLRSFADSYLREKGKNSATKEDIGEITRKVESIRSELAAISTFESRRREEQQKHVLAFYDVAVELLHQRYAVNFGDLPMDEGKSLYEFQTQFHSNIVALLREYQRLMLFVPGDSELTAHAGAIVNAAVKSQGIFKSNYGSVKVTSVAEQVAHASGDKEGYRRAVDKANVANQKYWAEMRPHISDFSEALQAFLSAAAWFLSKLSESNRA